MFTGRETRPLHGAIAYTLFPYIDGLTWNIENCYAMIKDNGIKMKDNGRWRVLAEISQEEKSIILDAVVKFIVASLQNTTAIDDVCCKEATINLTTASKIILFSSCEFSQEPATVHYL